MTPDEFNFPAVIDDIAVRVLSGELTGADPFPEDAPFIDIDDCLGESI
jgi:hypothetical protein